MRKIVLWCQAGSGSSCLSRIFETCGMNLGDKSTYYHGNYEHSLMTAIVGVDDENMAQSSVPQLEQRYQKVKGETQEEKIRQILRSYLTKNYNCCGMKITTGLTQRNFFKMLYFITSEWGEDTYFIHTVRHPLGSIMRLKADQRTDSQIPTLVEGLKGLNYGKMGLALKGAKMILYPEGYDDGTVKRVIEEVGLQWNTKADGIYNSSRPTRVTEDAMIKFEEEHPDLAYSYNLLKGLSCR